MNLVVVEGAKSTCPLSSSLPSCTVEGNLRRGKYNPLANGLHTLPMNHRYARGEQTNRKILWYA